jgi:hypothetical protein
MASLDLEQVTPSALDATDKAFVRRGDGPFTGELVALGSAAVEPADAFATAAQGALADTALQPGAQIPWTDVTGKPAFFSGAYGDLTGIPATFAPSAHTHGIADVTGLQAALDGAGPAGTSGQVQFNNGGAFGAAALFLVGPSGNLVMVGNENRPNPNPAGLQLFARDRAGALWLDVQRPNGRDFPLQPHMGVNRIATWAPSSSTVVVATGAPRTAVGTTATPALTATAPQPKNGARRWRMTSATTANAAADERSAVALCWRGDAPGIGGWTYTNRLSLTTTQTGAVAFFGMSATLGTFSTTQVLSALVNCIGIGCTVGTHQNWHVVCNDNTGAATLTDMGSGFPINTTDLLTLFIYADANASSIWVRVVNENTGASYQGEFDTNIPAATILLSVRNFMHNGGVAAAVAYDCCGVYLETDF